MSEYPDNLSNYDRKRKMFYSNFDSVETFTSTEAATLRKQEADEWWQKNHFETPEEHRFRTENFNRPSLGQRILI